MAVTPHNRHNRPDGSGVVKGTFERVATGWSGSLDITRATSAPGAPEGRISSIRIGLAAVKCSRQDVGNSSGDPEWNVNFCGSGRAAKLTINAPHE